jgi:hypothetical protein
VLRKEGNLDKKLMEGKAVGGGIERMKICVNVRNMSSCLVLTRRFAVAVYLLCINPHEIAACV